MRLTDAFAIYKAQYTNIRFSTIAPCPDGSYACALWAHEFVRLADGVLSHRSRYSEWGGTKNHAGDKEWLRALPVLLEEATPMRLIVAYRDQKGHFDVRSDLVGRVLRWDGEHLQIDFKEHP
jgi:hypothetical protein